MELKQSQITKLQQKTALILDQCVKWNMSTGIKCGNFVSE